MPDLIGSFYPSLACALMGLALALAPPARFRSLFAAAIVAFALGVASIMVAVGGALDAVELPTGFLAIAVGLLLPAPVSIVVMLCQLRGRVTASTGFLLASLMAALVVVIPLLKSGGWWPPVVAAAVITGVMLAPAWIGRRFRIQRWTGGVTARPSGQTGSTDDSWRPVGSSLFVAEAAFLTGAVLVRQADLLYAAVAGGVVVGSLARRAAGNAQGLPVGALVSLAAVSGAWWLTATAVDLVPGRTLAALRGVPFSLEVELLLALLLVGSAWPLARLWPFHGAATGMLSPLFALVLLVRVAVAAVPFGVIHWLPAAAAVAAIAAWHGAAARWMGEALIATGICAVLAIPDERTLAGPGLIVLGTFAARADSAGWSSLPKVLTLSLLAGAAALLPSALAQALAEETVWTTVLAAGLALAWSREWNARLPRVDLSEAGGHIPSSSSGITPEP